MTEIYQSANIQYDYGVFIYMKAKRIYACVCDWFASSIQQKGYLDAAIQNRLAKKVRFSYNRKHISQR